MDHAEAHSRYFDAHAASYDDYTAGDAWTPNLYLAGVLAVLAAEGVEVATAWDVGSGTGQSLARVREAFPRAELWASDVSPEMLRRAAAKVPAAYFEVADLSEQLAGPSRSFDLITAIGCLELVPDLGTVLPRLLARVNPGGHLVLTMEPVIDGGGSEQVRGLESSSDPRWHEAWSTARLLRALSGGELRSSHLFTAYHRHEQPILYELFVIRRG